MGIRISFLCFFLFFEILCMIQWFWLCPYTSSSSLQLPLGPAHNKTCPPVLCPFFHDQLYIHWDDIHCFTSSISPFLSGILEDKEKRIWILIQLFFLNSVFGPLLIPSKQVDTTTSVTRNGCFRGKQNDRVINKNNPIALISREKF